MASFECNVDINSVMVPMVHYDRRRDHDSQWRIIGLPLHLISRNNKRNKNVIYQSQELHSYGQNQLNKKVSLAQVLNIDALLICFET